MGPPPVDPNLESYGATPTSSLGLDLHLTSPSLQQRPYSYPKDLGLFLHDGQSSSMRPAPLELNPSLNAQPDPWDPQRINGEATQTQLMNHGDNGARGRIRSSGSYWDSHTRHSDNDSSTGRHLHDSGYYTQTQGTGTIFSGDIISTHDSQSMAGELTEMNHRRDELHPFRSSYLESPSDNQGGPAEKQHAYPFDLICEVCHHKSNNRSDFKYVQN